jgi:hypothetical protein
MRVESKPRIVSVPPELPYASLFWKLTPGTTLIVSRTFWPGPLREMNSCVMTALAFDASGDWIPPTSRVRVPVTTIASSSKSTVPVDWA